MSWVGIVLIFLSVEINSNDSFQISVIENSGKSEFRLFRKIDCYGINVTQCFYGNSYFCYQQIPETMNYYTSKTIAKADFEDIKMKVIDALKTEGFGVLTEIDLKTTMKKKLDKDYLPHTILGACNPVYADKVLQIEPNISTMLPCNVTIKELKNGTIEVATINPAAAMGSVNNAEIIELAKEVQAKLLKVLEGFG